MADRGGIALRGIVWGSLLSLPLWLLILGACDMLKPRKAVTPAPAGYEVGQSLTGKTYEIQMTPEQVDAFCRMKGALKAGETFAAPGCYIANMDAVVIPRRELWPSKREWNELRRHEWAHAGGWPGDHPETPRSGNIFAEPPMDKPGNIFRGR